MQDDKECIDNKPVGEFVIRLGDKFVVEIRNISQLNIFWLSIIFTGTFISYRYGAQLLELLNNLILE